jgi:uncharacterized phage protein (TIGR01671 family)
MKREIKFRAWVKRGNEIKDYVKPTTIQKMIHSKESTFSLEQLNDLVDFEQFTGLTDANGKDIYEGDVVRTGKDNIGDPEPMIGQVIMREGSWLIENEKKQEAIELFSEITSREVIGNIFEDKQLMEGKYEQK